MGNTYSVEEKAYLAARQGDKATLQTILQQVQRQGGSLQRILNYQDSAGYTPLIAAAARGHDACVELLLQQGANVHLYSFLPEATTALHECVARGSGSYKRVLELLLQYGANAFSENGRCLTPIDVAINKGYPEVVRLLERHALFKGTLQLKVPKFMGLGADWKQRWTVVMPRYPFPTANQPQPARLLLVCYKDAEQCLPVCKVWLDGAIARSVVGSRGNAVPQCALTLHKNHLLPVGAHMTGDQMLGYTMHLRPGDGSAAAAQGLRAFTGIVNGSRPGPPARPGPAASPTPAPIQPAVSPPSASHHPSESDEDIARKLQRQYDAEMAEYYRTHPEAARAQGKLSSTSGASTATAAAPPRAHHHSPSSSSSFHSLPSAPVYPDINPAAGQMHLMDGHMANAPLAAQALQGGSHSHSAANGGPSWHPAGVASASSPPPFAAAAAAARQRQQTGSPAPSADDEAGQCVICLEAPATAGFLHGESVHKCCCRACAEDLKRANVPTCPMCREPIEHVVFNFY